LATLSSTEWQQSTAEVFWGEIAPCDHVVQIYESDDSFLDLLSGYVGGGISASDSVIVIATDSHLKALKKRLESLGMHVNNLIETEQYIPMDAEDCLKKFMVNGWPDKELFSSFVSSLLRLARKHKNKVRAFGEMVAVLWAKGYNGATIHLEHLWCDLCEKEDLCLFCAYPKSGFTENLSDSLHKICDAHSKIVSPGSRPMSDVLYKSFTNLPPAV